jgi:GAF domain-containing protein
MAFHDMRTARPSAMRRAVQDAEAMIGAAGHRREIDLVIHRGLSLVAYRSGARHAYVCEYRDGRRRLFTTHEWCAPGIEAYSGLDLDPGRVSDWNRALQGCDAGSSRAAADHPHVGPSDLILSRRETGSTVVAALRVEGGLIGFLCLDYAHRTRVPEASEMQELAALSETVARAISRGKRSE